MDLKRLTLPARKRIVKITMQLLTPKWKIEIDQLEPKLRLIDFPRPFTKMLKTNLKGPLRGCEIGFGSGINAENLLQELEIETLYCIEPFTPFKENGVIYNYYKDTDKTPEYMERLHRLQRDPSVKFLHFTSDAIFEKELLPKGLDFIYIDGNHTFDYALRDIQNSMRFVRQGGYVGGHDFTYVFQSVIDAVIVYSVKNGLYPEVKVPDFWFKKGSTST